MVAIKVDRRARESFEQLARPRPLLARTQSSRATDRRGRDRGCRARVPPSATRISWNTIARPRLVGVERALGVPPLTLTVPESGGSTPASTFARVLLPLPFSPTTRVDLAGARGERAGAERARLAERLADVAPRSRRRPRSGRSAAFARTGGSVSALCLRLLREASRLEGGGGRPPCGPASTPRSPVVIRGLTLASR